jgi:hypothetical protein
MAPDDRRPRDVNALAARIVVAEATGEADKTDPPTEAEVRRPTSRGR